MLIYTVKPGDSIAVISRRYGLPPARIAADNGLRDASALVPGQNLLINTDKVRYIVSEGQTLFSIAQEYGVPLEQLIKANPGLDPLNIRPGDTVYIPVDTPGERRQALFNGYAYPSISTTALNCVLPFLTFVSPFSYTLTPRAELIPPDASSLVFSAERSAVMPLMVVTNIFGEGFSTENLSGILASEELQQRLIGNILAEVTSKRYYGVNMDIEYIAPEDRERYNAFLQRLADLLHEQGYIVVTALAPKISADQRGVLYEAHDYAAQGRIADYVIIMGYDEHWHGSKDPGSVASISYVSDGLDRTLQEVPANKVVNALPFYTILWKTEGTDVTDEYITMRNEADFMSKAGVSAEWDEVTCQNYAEWTSGSVNYQIWLEDAESIAVKLNMMTTKNIGGVAVWRLGYGTQAAWELINAYLQ